MPASERAAARLLKRCLRIGGKKPKRGKQAGNKARAKGEQHGEEQHSEIKMDFGKARQADRSIAQEQIQGRLGERRCRPRRRSTASSRFSASAFHTKRHLAAPRAVRTADSRVARQRAAKLRVGQVQACDQHQPHHCSHQQPQCGSESPTTASCIGCTQAPSEPGRRSP